MKIEELRIGSIVVNSTTDKIIRVKGISDDGFITVRKDALSDENIDIENIIPLYINDPMLGQIVDHRVITKAPRKKNIYYFPNQTATFFLVKLKESNFVIGMIDVKLPEKYRRLTKSFSEYHKLQNAHKTIFDTELPWLNI
ncbi:hypothetical protein [Flavobacterium sp. N502536]|uniref:hypothetical protein n=1 Tax=Flavobacterium sp. N502536 TaxID=2986837 RepID=UPI002223D8CC|nr:hypothetical protein [Flavobacterium sp. N502536]